MTSCPAPSSSVSTVRPRCSCQSRNNIDDGCFSTVPGGVGATGCVIKNYQPHGNLARILWEKQKADERLRAYDKTRVCIFYILFIINVNIINIIIIITSTVIIIFLKKKNNMRNKCAQEYQESKLTDRNI